MGKSPPSALLAISYIFIWVLSVAVAREPSVNKACVVRRQGYGGRVASEPRSVHRHVSCGRREKRAQEGK